MILLNDEQIVKAFYLSSQLMTDEQVEKLTQIDRFRILSRAQAWFAVNKHLLPCRHGHARLCDCPDCVKEIYDELGGEDIGEVV